MRIAMSKSKWVLAGLLVAVLGAAAVQSRLRLKSRPESNKLTESYYKLTRTPTESELNASDINPLPPLKIIADVTYGPHGWRNTLDLYLPENAPRPMPLVVCVHGGGAENVSKDTEKPSPWAQLLLHRGYALAQINYRVFEVSTQKPNMHNDVAAPFPAQLVDCKAAIRFLRSHAVEYEIDPNHIGVIGHSFGGYLSALIATTGDSHQFDDPETTDTTSSAVQAAVDLCGVLADLPTHKQHVLLHAKARRRIAGSL
jgi:acetyl esterase/lipase